MANDEYDIDSKTHKALISLTEDKNELCPMEHTIQILDSKVTNAVFDNCNHSQYSGHSNKNAITGHLQVEPQQLEKTIQHNQKELDHNSPSNTKGKSFYTNRQCSNLEAVMNHINVSETFNNNYDIILEDGNQNNLPEHTVLYIMDLMFNNIYLRLINSCNNALNIVKKHKVKGLNSQDIENNIEQFEISRENINAEFNQILTEQELGIQYQNIFTLLHEQPELLFTQIIDLQDSLKEFELLFSDSQDLNGTIKRLQKCINSADTFLLSNIEQVEIKDISTKNAKKPFNQLMNVTSVANMLCDSLTGQDIAGANPQYFMDLSTKINKIKKGLYINDLARNMYLDFSGKYIQVVNSIFSDNTLCFNALDQIQTNIRNYTRGTSNLNQKTAANAEIKFLFTGIKFIVEKIDTMIESYFKPQDVIYNNKITKQQDQNTYNINRHYSTNNAYMRNISTQYSNHNELTSLNTNPLKDQNPINTHSDETDNSSLHTRTKRNTDTITDTIPTLLSNESSLTNIVVDIINNDSNNTSMSMENKNSTHNIMHDTPNDLINKVNIATKTNIQTTHAETETEHDNKEHVANRAVTNVKASYLASADGQKSKRTSSVKEQRTNTTSTPKKYANLHSYPISLADIAVRSDIVTTGTFTSITHQHKIHSTIDNTRTVPPNDKDAAYHNDNIQNSNNRIHYIPTTYQLVVNTAPLVNIYNEANIINNNTTNTTTTFEIEYNAKTLNNNVNHIEYIIGHKKLISNNLANNKGKADNLTLYNGTAIDSGILQYQQLYYNITLPSNTIYYPKLLNLSNFVSLYKSLQDIDEIFKRRAGDKILINHISYNTRKDRYSFLDALNYGHKMFNIILTRTNTYQELHKQYPNKSVKELLLTSSLINDLDADERQNLTNIYMGIAANILGSSQNAQYAQRMSFATKLQPLILKHDIANPKHQITAYGIDGLAIDIQDSKLQIDNIAQDVTLRTASIPTYIDPKLGVKSISLAFTDSFGHMPLESEVLYMTIHYDNTGNIVASHYPPTMQFISNRPVIRTLKGNYFGPCTQDTIQQLERYISINGALSANGYKNRLYGS